MRRSFRYKLYNNKKNRWLGQILGVACEIYNWCIIQHKEYYKKTGKYLQLNDIQKMLTIKRNDTPEWGIVGSQACQDITERIHNGYQKFFRKENKRPPTLKKPKKYKSFTLKQAGYTIFDNNSVRIGETIYRYHKSREICGIVKTVMIKRDAVGDFYVIFSTINRGAPKRESKITGNAAGFDWGCATYLTSSEGTKYEAPLPLNHVMKEVKRVQRAINRCVAGSNNQKKLFLGLARLHRSVAYQRSDWHHKLVNYLLDHYDILFFETLSMRQQQRNHGKKVGDQGFSKFLEILEYKAESLGKVINKIDKWFPSTQLCNCCGYRNRNLKLKDREWSCPSCGARHDRDINAAINIYNYGFGIDPASPKGRALPEGNTTREGASSLRYASHTSPGPKGPGSV